MHPIIILEGKPLPIFPVLANKKPATPHGFKDATADPTAIADLFRRHPGPLIGVPTGQVSGINALDVDPKNGGGHWLRDNRARLPTTRIHETPSGGQHLIFRHSRFLRNSASKIAPGIDVRGDDGYVVWWPAACGRVLCDGPIAEWPQWILAALKPQGTDGKLAPSAVHLKGSVPELPILFSSSKFAVHPRSREASYAHVALTHAMNELLNARPGERNSKLNVRAYSLGRLAARGWITVEKIVHGLELACQHNLLTRDDGLEQTMRTIASGLRAGMARPYPDIRRNDA